MPIMANTYSNVYEIAMKKVRRNRFINGPISNPFLEDKKCMKT
jgi:hypothetical protein